MTPRLTLTLTTTLMSLCLFGCESPEDPHDHNENELITTVELTFTPSAGDALVFAWTDPEGDGSPVIDNVELAELEAYTLDIRFLNELEEPAEDITEEVDAEGDEHQVFLTGDAVMGPAAGANANAPLVHSYADTDADGLPLGLSNDIDTTAGAGDLIVTLRHLPPENDAATKVADLAATVASEGFAAIPGDTDVQVTFPVVVQ